MAGAPQKITGEQRKAIVNRAIELDNVAAALREAKAGDVPGVEGQRFELAHGTVAEYVQVERARRLTREAEKIARDDPREATLIVLKDTLAFFRVKLIRERAKRSANEPRLFDLSLKVAKLQNVVDGLEKRGPLPDDQGTEEEERPPSVVAQLAAEEGKRKPRKRPANRQSENGKGGAQSQAGLTEEQREGGVLPPADGPAAGLAPHSAHRIGAR